ncbi:MAG: hypothetical protein HON90_05670 [Halobacteriovoraceae bacterium]|jgi:hypothetical protein|nr:hypothetical protein [Halobacteriovoraceae bacterium]
MKNFGNKLLKTTILASVIMSANVQAAAIIYGGDYIINGDSSYRSSDARVLLRVGELSLKAGGSLAFIGFLAPFGMIPGLALLTLDENSSAVEIEESLMDKYTVLHGEPELARDLSSSLAEALKKDKSTFKIVAKHETEQGTITLREVPLGEKNLTELLEKHDVDLSRPEVQELMQGLK